FAAYSFDPDVGDIASVTIEWGDGDVQAATRSQQAIGIWPVIYDDSSFEARVEGTHAYSNPGTYTLRVCVSDSVNGASLSTCNEPAVKTLVEQTVVVDQLIDLVVTTDDSLPKFEEPDCPEEARANDDCPLRSEPVIDGNPVTYIATIENRQLGDNTQPATNIEASFEFPPELTPLTVQIAAPGGAATSGAIDGQFVTAIIPSLAVEATATVSVLTSTPGNLIEDRRVDVNGKVRRVLIVDDEVTEPEEFADPSGRNPIARQTQIILDPEGDIDGDGVPNGDDAFPADPSESRDNDGDGIGDNGDPDDDNDRMPDRWERRFGFDPFNDGEGTLDGD
ncbi:MAG: PKD domain-containing protein, partial [Pseudomonadota bacterium]